MTRTALALGKKPGKSQAPLESVERLLNGYLTAEPTGKEPTPIFGTPGLISWCQGLDGAIRGGLEMTGTPYVVAGGKLYSVDSAGSETVLGDIPNTDLVSMAGDGTNVAIVTAGDIYVWNGSALGLVTDPDAPDAAWVVWLDGFFIFGEIGTQIFFISALADPTDFDALDFAAAERLPDDLIAGIVLHRTLYLGGAKTLEAQQNTGGSDFPFSRYEGVYVDTGMAGRDAAVVTNDQLYWFAQDRTFRRLDGITAKVISDGYVARVVKEWSDISATVASAHVLDDHLFIVWRNPDGCVVYDQTTELWHERGSHELDSWRVRHLIDCYGKTLACSAIDGTIYELDAETYDEDGEPLLFQSVTPYAYAGNMRLTVNDVEAVMQMGVGSLSLNPQAVLRKTTNGRTYGNPRAKRLGLTGSDAGTARFGPQGQGRAMAFELSISDPVKRALLGIYIDFDAEAA